MSEPAVRAELQITLKDGATAGVKAITDTAVKATKTISEASESAAKKYVLSQKEMTASAIAARKRVEEASSAALKRQEVAEKTAIGKYAQNMEARRTLGIRSENEIQKEITKTEEAYKRLAGSGVLSAQQQERALNATKQKVTALTNEMGKLTAEQKKAAATASDLERVQSRMRTGVALAAGVGAAAYTLSGPAKAAMSFDERLAGMANTSYAERDTAGRRVGMQQLEAAINKSVSQGGGGTREQAAETLDTLIASGAVSADEAMRMLPQLMKASSASGADANQLAQIGIRAKQTFKISADEMPNVLNMALTAGQAGGFELKDMARWLPQQMAAATLSGLSGRAGFAKLAALNQAAAISAGTKDEAGNNVVNLLAKINSSDTAKDAEKLGINLPKYLQEERAKGNDSVDAFGALVDKTVANREDYKALKKRLDAAKTNDDKRATLEAMATIAQGAGIGKLVQDRQALMALLGMMNNRKYMDQVLDKVKVSDVSENGPIDKNYELMSGTSAFKMRMAEQQKDIGQKSAMDGLTPAIGKMADMFSDLASKHPLLVGSVTLATTALGALAGAAGLASMTMGGGKGGAIAAAALKYGSKASKFLKVGGIAGAVALGGEYALEKGFGEDSAITRYGSSALTGASMGAMAGSIVPVIGTGIGAAIGGGLGLLYEALKTTPQKPVDVNAKMTVGLAPGLVLQNQSMQSSGSGNVQMNTGSIWGTP
jgi:hypothetical protein